MSIYVVTGKPRHGKTFFVVSQIPGWLKSGQRIFSNVKINLDKINYRKNLLGKKVTLDDSIVGDLYNQEDLDNPEKQVFYWRNIHEWNLMKEGIIIVDEAQKYFNARNWAQLSEDTEAKLQEHGKEDLDVWATTQHYTRIDITLRILVERYYKVEMIFGSSDNEKGPIFGLLPKRSMVESWLLEGLDKVERLGAEAVKGMGVEPESTGYFWIRKKYYQIYDTRAKVGKSQLMPLLHKMRICKDCGYVEIKHA